MYRCSWPRGMNMKELGSRRIFQQYLKLVRDALQLPIAVLTQYSKITMSGLLIMLFSYMVYSRKLQREQFSTVPICRKTDISNRGLGWRSHMAWACFSKQGEISPSPYSTCWHQAELFWGWKVILSHFANGEVGLQIRWPSTQEQLKKIE